MWLMIIFLFLFQRTVCYITPVLIFMSGILVLHFTGYRFFGQRFFGHGGGSFQLLSTVFRYFGHRGAYHSLGGRWHRFWRGFYADGFMQPVDADAKASMILTLFHGEVTPLHQLIEVPVIGAQGTDPQFPQDGGPAGKGGGTRPGEGCEIGIDGLCLGGQRLIQHHQLGDGAKAVSGCALKDEKIGIPVLHCFRGTVRRNRWKDGIEVAGGGAFLCDIPTLHQQPQVLGVGILVDPKIPQDFLPLGVCLPSAAGVSAEIGINSFCQDRQSAVAHDRLVDLSIAFGINADQTAHLFTP